MKAIVFILLPLIVFNVDLNNYSINAFLDYLQHTGYYEVIEDIKIYAGIDVAIDFCLNFIQSNDCEKVIKFYMSSYSHGIKDDTNPIELISLVHQDKNQKVLLKFYPKEEIELRIKKILLKKGISTKKIEEYKDKYA